MMGAPKSIGAVTCPHCQAGPGAPCIGDGEGYHVARFSAALGPQGANPAPAEPEKVTDPHACGVPADAEPLWVRCPPSGCEADKGERCTDAFGFPREPHRGRVLTARAVDPPAPEPVGPMPVAPCPSRFCDHPPEPVGPTPVERAPWSASAPEPLPFSATDVALLLDVADAIVMRVEGWPMTAGALRDLADRLDAAL